MSLQGTDNADHSSAEKARSDSDKLRLIEKATEQWHTVNRWMIEYEVTPSAVNTLHEIPLHGVAAVAAPGDYHHFSGHFPPGSNPWQEDPFDQETFIHQGIATHRWRFVRTYSEAILKAGDYLPGSTPQNVLWLIIPNWPLTEYKMPADVRYGAPVLLVDALRSPDCRILESSEASPISTKPSNTPAGYRLLSISRSDDDEGYVVFDYKGIERFWIASSKGLCLMQRDSWDPHSKKLIRRILTDKVDEVAPGLWLPVEIRVQYFQTHQRTNEDVIVQENKLRILRCLLNNDVPDSIFIPVHRPGSIKFDNEGKFIQVAPGGEDLLDDIINFMTKYAHLPSKPLPRNHPYLWLVGSLATGLCAGFLLFPMSKRHSRKAKVRGAEVSVADLKL